MSRHNLLLILLLLAAAFLSAQSSASYTLEEHTLNNGGDPQNGVVLTSASFQITLDAIGDPVAGVMLSGSSFTIDGMNRLPGEVLYLLMGTPSGVTTLTWDPENSIGDYTVYRGDLSGLPGSYGSAIQPGIATELFEDKDPYTGQSYFYLVTASNRLAEEGTLGFESGGTERE